MRRCIDDIMSRLSEIFDDANHDGVLQTTGTPEAVYARYKYLGAGQIVEEDYADIDVKLSYLDANGNVTGLDRFGRVVDQVWTDYSGTPTAVDRYTYEYDRAGNRTAKDNELHSAFDEDYTYDAIARLATATRADSFDQSWTLDGLGNFSAFDDDGDSQTREVNAANEITTMTGSAVTPAYDAAGNMISGPKTGDETSRIHYAYDAWNRLVAVYADDTQDPGQPGDVIATYAYDGVNRRVTKTLADGTSTEFYYNQQWQVLEERSLSAQQVVVAVDQYVWDQSYVDAPLVRYHDGNADGDCNLSVQDDPDDTIRYYTWDANHNVTSTRTVDAAATTTVKHYVYDAYGKATVYDNAWQNGAAPSEDGPLYCGYWFDLETGNYLARNRYYSVALSSWISRDPIGYRGGINLYEYCGDDPLMHTDPDGLLRICCRNVKDEMLGSLIRHCDMREGPCDKDTKTEWSEEFPVWQSTDPNRTLDNGTPCSCATSKQVAACLSRHPYSPDPRGTGNGIGSNCQTSTLLSIGSCCLNTTWRPNWYAGGLRGKCLKSHTEYVQTTFARVPTEICDQWELPDWKHDPTPQPPKKNAGASGS